MINYNLIIKNAVEILFRFLLTDIISVFGIALSDLMATSLDVLRMPFVQSGIRYARLLALTLLVIKVMNEAFQTYILYQSGDPDSDPTGLVIRTAQSAAVIVSCQFIIEKVFEIGSKIATDIASLGSSATHIGQRMLLLIEAYLDGGTIMIICGLIIVISLLVVSVQAAIRGAELALMSIIGPILALNITSNNRSAWSGYFKQLIIVCTSQALQIFLLQGVLALLISQKSILIIIGWSWVTIKTPKWIQQFTYSTGFTNSVGGGLKQAGSMLVMRKVVG